MEWTTGRRPAGDGGRVAVLVVKGGGGGDRVLGHRFVHAVVLLTSVPSFREIYQARMDNPDPDREAKMNWGDTVSQYRGSPCPNFRLLSSGLVMTI